MKRILVLTLAVLLTAGVALAQGRGGMMGGGNPPANGPGNMGPGHGGPGGPGGPGGALVAADGTIILPRVVSDSATNTATTELVAVSPSGAKLWSITTANRGHLTLSGSNLLSVSQAASGTTVTSSVSAIAIATGAAAWTLNVNGQIHGLIPFSGGTYAVVVVPPATTAGTTSRSLIAISNTGTILWKLDV